MTLRLPNDNAHEGNEAIEGPDERLQALNHQLARRERQNREIDAWARDLLKQLEERAQELERVREELHNVKAELDRVRGSAAYRVISGAARQLRRWTPKGTSRKRRLSRASQATPSVPRQHPSHHTSFEPSPPDGSEDEFGDWTQPLQTPARYRTWIQENEPGVMDLERQRREASALSYRPLISILIPTRNPPEALIRETIRSVQEQTYVQWEVCIADGDSDEQIRDVLADLKGSESRIRLVHLDRNLGIAGNTNQALALARGDYVAFLDQTDTLAPFALYEVAASIDRDPGLDVLYSDWDLLSEDSEVRFNPFFTPEWSPELLLSTNFMAHFLVARRSLVNDAGKLRSEMDGAQDWDLIFRLTERTDRIRRVPGVLYHWRADQASTVFSLDAKPTAETSQRMAVEEHLARRGLQGGVRRSEEGHLRIDWDVTGSAKVSIIIPTRHNRELLTRCLETIVRSDYSNREVVVVETAGHNEERADWYRRLATRFPIEVLWWNEPFNYSVVNNWAAAQTSGDVLLFLNDDTEALTDGWLTELVGWVEKAEIGVVGAHLVDPNGTLQHGGVVIGLGGFADHLFRGLEPGKWSLLGSTMWYRNLTAVTGACLAIRRDLFEQIGGWDERYVLNGSDVDLCLRARRAGLRIVCTPFARLRHVEGATRGGSVPDWDYFLSYWRYQRYLFGGDPFFNPNLSYLDPIPRLIRGNESPLSVISKAIGRDVERHQVPGEEEHAAAMARASQVGPLDVKRNLSTHSSLAGRREVTAINWFIPDFDGPYYGGIHTVFRFADHFQKAYGVKNRFISVGVDREEYVRSGLEVTFPELADAEIFIATQGSDALDAGVPDADASIATQWPTAYPLARFPSSGRKFYFIQDFEPMFYPAGTRYALAEETYRMGFYGIANSPPLKDIYESYGSKAIAFSPCIDADVFHGDRMLRPDEPLTVFMYGRPGHPRNCYELATAALERVKASMKDQVRIVAAGSWNGAADTPSWLSQLGWLEYEETAELYRRCEVGLVLSVSKHPTYIPLQLMGCGALVIANRNPANEWLLRAGENCIIADPTAEGLSEALETGLRDHDLRGRLTDRARRDIVERHSNWGSEIERVYRFMCDPHAS